MVNLYLIPFALNQYTPSKPLFGFTLIEVLITSTIITLLVSMAVPSFAKLWQKQQADVYVATLQRAMATARYSAITSREIVSLCPYSETACGEEWENGIMIFIDKNNNGIIDDKETLMEFIDFAPNNSTISWRASGRKNYLRYSPTGMARQFGRFHICDKEGDLSLARALVISRQGRTRVYRDRNNDGVVEDTNGAIPAC
ncbi:GspH/FimT family pseudopilin [Pseudomonadales bacterium]|nr:GspH/FimT family pseudopilin [Pseudomonadales bacterium]